MLKSLLVRTYFPSIFSGHLINNVEETSDSTDKLDDYCFEEDETVSGNERVQDVICDPLFGKGQLHPYIDLGMADFL